MLVRVGYIPNVTVYPSLRTVGEQKNEDADRHPLSLATVFFNVTTIDTVSKATAERQGQARMSVFKRYNVIMSGNWKPKAYAA